MPVEEHDVAVDGRRVHYLVAGSGPPLLLLHAVGESSASWRHVLPALAAGHTAYALDLPGFGHSAPMDGAPSPPRFAAVAAAILDAVSGRRDHQAVVVGSSLGGTIGIELALRYPARVGRLALIDSAGLGCYINPVLCALTLPGVGDVAAWAGRTRLGARQRAWLRLPLLFARPELAPPEWVREQQRLATLPDHLRTTLAALREQVSPLGQRRVLLDALPRLEVPTLLVWGAQDAVVPLGQAQAAASRLSRGRLEVVPWCGHLPHVERPERFVAALDRFLEPPAAP